MKDDVLQAKECPICQKRNHCEGSDTCWCSSAVFPSGIFELVPADQLNKSCICLDCLNEFKKAEEEIEK